MLPLPRSLPAKPTARTSAQVPTPSAAPTAADGQRAGRPRAAPPLGRAAGGAWFAWLTRRGVAAAVVLGVLVRTLLVLSSDFPLNDGALFLEMTRAVRAAHYHLPVFVPYNGTAVPFGYPPLGFYLVAALHDALGLDMVQALRVLPLLATCGCVAAFAALARDLLPRVARGVAPPDEALLGSVLAFALLPRSYVWLLMGGGLTRSLGFLFAILAAHQAVLLYTRRGWRHAGLLGLCAGLSVLSHIGTAPFTAVSIALVFVAFGRHRTGLVGSALALAIVLALVAPWAAAVVAEHGWAPFVAAKASGRNMLSDPDTGWQVRMTLAELTLHETGEPLFPFISVLAVLGAVASARAGQLLLGAWWVAIFVIDARAPGTYASVPVAMLAGLGIAAVWRPVLFPAGVAPVAPVAGRARSVARLAPWVVAFGLFGYVLLGAVTRNESVGGEGKLLRAVPAEERAAMAWVRRATPPDAQFAVITGPGHTGVWGDRVSEWFPVLAGRRSVATLQGREWINDGAFYERETLYKRLQGCASQTPECLATWSAAARVPFTHVFVSKERSFARNVQPLTTSLRGDPGYTVLYDGPGALVLARRPREPIPPGRTP